MPELPEVEALAAFLRENAVGHILTRVDLAAVQAIKTFDPPLSALGGLEVTGASRHGKFLDLDVSGLHLVVHLARAGWLHWRTALPPAPPKPGKGPLALWVHLSPAEDGALPDGFDLTEAGTRKGLAVWLVRDVAEVPSVARLGPEPLDPSFTPEVLAGLLAGSRKQLKGLLRDQSVVAGIGGAYSDEVLHAARLSPFTPAGSLSPEEVTVLWQAVRDVLTSAVERSRGLLSQDLKQEKKAGLRVHGRTGQPCPVCGDTVREVSFADSSLQYCPTCQTGGKPLADRRLSKLLK